MPREKDTRGRIRNIPIPGEGSERKKFTRSKDRKAARSGEKSKKSRSPRKSAEEFRQTHEGQSPQGPKSPKEGERHRRHAEKIGDNANKWVVLGRRGGHRHK